MTADPIPAWFNGWYDGRDRSLQTNRSDCEGSMDRNRTRRTLPPGDEMKEVDPLTIAFGLESRCGAADRMISIWPARRQHHAVAYVTVLRGHVQAKSRRCRHPQKNARSRERRAAVRAPSESSRVFAIAPVPGRACNFNLAERAAEGTVRDCSGTLASTHPHRRA